MNIEKYWKTSKSAIEVNVRRTAVDALWNGYDISTLEEFFAFTEEHSRGRVDQSVAVELGTSYYIRIVIIYNHFQRSNVLRIMSPSGFSSLDRTGT